MKLLVILFIPLTCFCQQQPGQNFIYSNSGFAWSTTTLQSVDSISTCTTLKNDFILVTDTLRGGIFTQYSGDNAVDNGMIFADALNRKWKRQLGATNAINILWYGLSNTASINSSTNYNAFMGAYNYVTTHRLTSDIFIPAGTYNFNQTITIDTTISIKGVGNYYDWKTIFVFPENTTGFRLKTKEGGLLNTVVDIQDLELRANANYNNPGTLTLDSSKHAFDISCIVHFNEVHVYGWAGNGFNIDACATNGASNFGNSDNSYFYYCGADLCNNGIYFNGCDANIITVSGSSFTLNRRFNIRDNGFLGNNYHNNHLAYGGVYKTFCTALYNGVYYVAINADTLLNVNKRPDLNPDYWEVITFVPETVNTWDNSTRYWQGGSRLIENANNYSTVIGEYVEASQPPTRNRGRALSIGGDNGSGQAEGANIYANDGWVYVKNAGVVTENLNTTGTVTISGQSGIPVLNNSGTLSSITGTASQILRRNAANTGYEFATIAAGGITQSALDDTATNIRSTVTAGLAGKQNTLGNSSVTNAMLAGSIAQSNITNYAGYTINVQALTSSPADAQTIYFGTLPKAPVTAAATSKIYIRQAGTITGAELYCYSGTAGTNESWSIYIRLNNTTDYLIATVGASTNERVFRNTGLSISVSSGDYIEIKSVNPTWATNPLTCIFGGYIRIN